jgi:polysaccharide pyruvyl transferase WcaK-like protein
MKILVEQSGYPLANLGDVSMLQVALARLNNLWPDALIEVFTCAPDKLEKFCENAHPVELSGHTIWYFPLIGRLYQLLPSQLAEYWSEMEWKLRHNSPSLTKSLMQLKLKARPSETKALRTFIKAVYEADLVVATGGGYITDEFEDLATKVLGVLGMAKKLGKPTVMLGQGLGPLENPNLRTKAKAVLPLVDLITLREQRASMPLLNSLGVSPNRVIVTGDDALELAYQARNPELGYGIGVNLRMAKYAEVNVQIVEKVRLALQDYVLKKETQLIPIPISQYDSDSKTIQQLLRGYDDKCDGGQSLDTPLKIIKQIGHCRIVVTGSYHAAVFALAQGIPVICLAKSKYYIDKFFGLAEQFGSGCEVILLDDEQLQKKLIFSIDQAWKLAKICRENLLVSAKQQIGCSHVAYQQIYTLVESRHLISHANSSLI